MMTPGFWQKVYQGWLAADLDSDRAQRWIELLVKRDVSLCPTLTVAPGAGDTPDAQALTYVPRVAERWQEASRMQGAVTPQAQERARGARAKLQELVGRVHRAGGRIVGGTDTGAIRNLVPGFALHEELSYLSGAGLSNMDVLRAATARAAEALWRSDLGTIEPGKRADLLLLRRNPLDDLAALRDIQRVVLDGRGYVPEELLARQTKETAGAGS
jgi:imidazolonepropionase-like amidohydrolase